MGDPIKNPKVTKSNGWNQKGGLFGLTRYSGTKFHNGIDIDAPLNSDLFSLQSGVVTYIENGFSTSQFQEYSYGNYIEIKSNIDGKTVYMRYNHLNSINVTVGSVIYAGQKIGKTGDTGNAQSTEEVTVLPHVHISAEVVLSGNTRASTDPNKYMATKYNSNGSVNTTTSTCN